MTEQQVRAVVVEALEYSNVIALRNKQLADGFLAGSDDVPIGLLEMDSLAEMEVCIAIEVHTGVSIVPEQLRRAGSLGRLVALIRARP